MANQRAPGQRLINFAADDNFIVAMDAAMRKAGARNRSEFIRDLLAERLGLAPDLALPPSRIGKGGPKVVSSTQSDAKLEALTQQRRKTHKGTLHAGGSAGHPSPASKQTPDTPLATGPRDPRAGPAEAP